MRLLSLDTETYSSIELSDSGVYAYTESPDFEILLIGYKWIDEPDVHVIDLTSKADFTPEEQEVIDALTDPDIRKCAWNAAFERTCFARWLHRPMPPEQWEDTMVRALELGLPGSLANAGIALGLPAEKLKDTRGKLLINYFSKPCKPTKANGGRTRNLPAHDPDKWKLYIEYNRQDVVTEQAIRDLLMKKVRPVQSEWDLWYLDQRINNHGVRVDLDMAEQIVRFDERRRIELQEEAREITGLENPNSLIQLKGWLEKRGYPMETVTKDSVEEMLKQDLPADVRRVIEIRQALGKTSVAKYSAMLDAACRDERVRGTFQFYGAARTGRFAGRLIQLQNLSRNTIPDLDLARRLVCEGRFDDVEMLYGEPAFVFSELVRTAFIPSPGHHFIVADFSAIEARVLAWLAGEEWVLDAFRAGKDIYCETASKMYHCNVVKHGENGHLRQKGKVATLACIAKGQPVLTDQGLVPIQQVTTDMKVWDGEEWVNHDGVVCRGEREVIIYDGLTATPDHPVFIEGEQGPVQFGFAAASGAHLVQSGNGGIRTQEKLADDKGTAYVYDIRNAGRRHRFTVSGRLVHNCGYGGGIGAMKRMDRSGSIPEDELQSVVDQWRNANGNIVRFWRRAESAARMAIAESRNHSRPVRVNGRIAYYYEGGNLYAKLPNGRSICYWGARLKQDPTTGRDSIIFLSVNTAHQWAEEETYSGKLTENLTQAVARDCLAETIRRVSAMGYQIVMHVHDEIIVDVPVSDKDAFQKILEAMKEPVPWAPDLPLNADGYICDYYRKD